MSSCKLGEAPLCPHVLSQQSSMPVFWQNHPTLYLVSTQNGSSMQGGTVIVGDESEPNITQTI